MLKPNSTIVGIHKSTKAGKYLRKILILLVDILIDKRLKILNFPIKIICFIFNKEQNSIYLNYRTWYL